MLVAYPLHIMLQNSSVVYRRWLIEKGLTLLGFLKTKMKTCKENELGVVKVGASLSATGSLARRRFTQRN